MSGGILSGPGIQQGVEAGVINIDPFEPKHINPASIDLRLGDSYLTYAKWVGTYAKWVETYDAGGSPAGFRHYERSGCHAVIDIKEPVVTNKHPIPKEGLILQPGILYLMHTFERVHSDHFVPVLDGKSSIGRLGIQVHVTAGFGDPGYDGQYTLEVTVIHPIRIYSGMRFCQMRFHTLEGEKRSYRDTGQYTGEAAQGAVASMAYTQFQEES